jgi:1,4-dihydroxy-2-naphthoate polyprenyltransferase
MRKNNLPSVLQPERWLQLLPRFWTFLMDVRAPYFASIGLPIFLGSTIAWWMTGTLDIGIFALSLLAGVFLQAGNTMTNDYFDYQRSGDIRAMSPLVPPQQVLQGALGFFVVGVMVGVYIAVLRGWLVLGMGGIGLLFGYLYSVPSWRLGGTGIGELLAGLTLGLLTTLGAFYVQTQQVSQLVGWAALPVALLMSAVLILTGFLPGNMETNPRSLWARLGKRAAGVAYGIPAMVGYGVLIVGVALAHLPQLLLIGLLGLPLAVISMVMAQMGQLQIAIVSAIGAHLGTTTLLWLSFILSGFL